MLTDGAMTIDGVALARIVRAVAAQSRRTLKRPVDPVEVRDLLRAIDSLEQALARRPSGSLSRWTANLRWRIESHAMATV